MKKTYFIAIGLLSAAVLIGVILFFGSRPQPGRFLPGMDKNIIIDTNRFLLSIKKIRYSSVLYRPLQSAQDRVAGGSITRAGKNAIILRGRTFIHFDSKADILTPLNIIPPENGSQGIKHFLSQWPSEPHPQISPFKTRYNSILVIKHQKTMTLLINYNYWNTKDLCYNTRLARIDFPAGQNPLDWTAQADDWKVIFETSPCIKVEDHQPYFAGHQLGGQMIPADKQGHILITIGDFGYNGSSEAGASLLQNANSDYGRIIEINIDNGQKTNISIGHRNPQGIARGKDGKIWSTEHGPRGGDELNLIQKGKNYGWPFTTYGTDYEKHIWPLEQGRQGRHDRYQKPVFAFVPSIGISSLAVIDDFAPEWDGDLLIASLLGRTLYRMRIVDGRAILTEPIHLGVRIRYIYNHGGGTLLAISDEGKKSIFVIRQHTPTKPMTAAKLDGVTQSVWNRCIVCHSTGPASTSAAPTLRGVFNRRIGQSDFRHYSPDMKSSRQRWTRKNLTAFLTQPDAMFEETTMPDPDIDDPRIIQAIIDHLETLKP